MRGIRVFFDRYSFEKSEGWRSGGVGESELLEEVGLVVDGGKECGVRGNDDGELGAGGSWVFLHKCDLINWQTISLFLKMLFYQLKTITINFVLLTKINIKTICL